MLPVLGLGPGPSEVRIVNSYVLLKLPAGRSGIPWARVSSASGVQMGGLEHGRWRGGGGRRDRAVRGEPVKRIRQHLDDCLQEREAGTIKERGAVGA